MKKMQTTFATFMLLGAAVTLSLTSCQKESSNTSSTRLSVMLTDGPGDFDAVNLDVLNVEVKVDSSREHRNDDRFGDNDDHRDDHQKRKDEFGDWVSLNTTPGVYNLLDLRNGVEAQLATGTINGMIRKIRITLGANNTVVKDGVTYPLTTVNETQNYLYVNLHREHRHDSSGTAKVWVDFDVARSIVLANGVYYLKPHLRPFCDNNFAGVEGKVTPAAAATIVKAILNGDTATAIPNLDGRFKIRGLAEGTYKIVYDGNNNYVDTTIENVVLTKGRFVRLPEVVLHQ